MLTILGSIITPAIVASLFTLLFNARSAKRKDYRDAVTKRIEEARTLVTNAVVAAADYFSQDAGNRLPQHEAKLWMAEREVRLSLTSLTVNLDDKLTKEVEKLENDFDFFLGELTGGNFQQKSGTADLLQVRKIAGLGAELRQSIWKAHEVEFLNKLEEDTLTKAMKFFQIRPYYTPLTDNDIRN